MKNFLNKLLIVLALAGMAGAFVLPATTSAQSKDDLCAGLNIATGQGCPDTATSDAAIAGPIQTVIKILSLVVGIVAVIMIIIGGLKYITSGGDSGSVTSAKNTILYAVVGLVVAVLAQIIVRFVVNRAAG